jgi:hypothetical protein
VLLKMLEMIVENTNSIGTLLPPEERESRMKADLSNRELRRTEVR